MKTYHMLDAELKDFRVWHNPDPTANSPVVYLHKDLAALDNNEAVANLYATEALKAAAADADSFRLMGHLVQVAILHNKGLLVHDLQRE